MDQRRMPRRRLLATLAILGVILAGGIATHDSTPAHAADYPSWGDVLEARKSESAKKAEVSRLQGLLAELKAQVAAAQQEAMDKGDEYIEAQNAYDEAAYKLDTLRVQVDEATAAAAESRAKAGQMAARMQRVSNTDLTATLLFTESDDLLGQLGRASKVGEQSSGLFAKATQDENNARSLEQQAAVQEEALAELAEQAEIAMVEAQQAADAAVAAEAEQQDNHARLEAQLAVLVENREATEADYQAGERARIAAEQARLAAEAEARRKAAEEAAKNNPPTPAPGNPPPASQGWVRPSGGVISSYYGPRIPPTHGASSFHGGVDFAPGCGAPIYAVASGTVTFAAMTGGYGNYVKVRHGDGSESAYAHIRPGGILVGYGQQVSAGQVIAYVGTTGISTGCHLHFEIRVGGSTVNPLTYLRQRGVGI